VPWIYLYTHKRHVLPSVKGRKAPVIQKTPTRVPKGNAVVGEKRVVVKKY
jgi:hypothetical protein